MQELEDVFAGSKEEREALDALADQGGGLPREVGGLRRMGAGLLPAAEDLQGGGACSAIVAAAPLMDPESMQLTVVKRPQQPAVPSSSYKAADAKTCNICEQVFMDKKAGVCKGASWWRCHACYRAEERLRATVAEEGRSKIIADIKRKDKAEYKRLVMDLARTHIRFQSQKSDCTRLLDSMKTTNRVQFDDGVDIITEEFFCQDKIVAAPELSMEDAKALWKQALANSANELTQWQGETCIVKKLPARVVHRRAMGWERQLAGSEKALVGQEALAKGMSSLKSLSQLDAPAEPGFAPLGARLLRAAGSLPALTEQAGDAPLPLQPRLAADPPLSQDSADGGDRRRSSAGGSAKGSPARGVGGTQKLALKKHEILAQFICLTPALARAQKALTKITEDKRYAASAGM